MLTTVLATLSFAAPQSGPELAVAARHAAVATAVRFKDLGLKEDQLGATLIVLDRKAGSTVTGSYRGDQPMYPASVVKMFYLAYLGTRLDQKSIEMTPELERATKDMIVESSNDATALVLDTITGTTGGPELPPDQLKAWMKKRNIVNEWLGTKGFVGINANQKTWNEAPYGRERQGYGPNFEYRNSLTPDACARLMAEIALDKVASPERCAWMRRYLKRNTVADGEADYQSRYFTGKVLPAGSVLYSKAGYTSEVRHDVAHIVTPDQKEFVIAIFMKGFGENTEIIPYFASEVLKGLGVLPRAEGE